jgi:hypothetical protein
MLKTEIKRNYIGNHWKIFGKANRQAIQSHLEYGSAAWYPTSNTTLLELDKVQNQALRVMMGAMKSTPIVEMEKTERTQSPSEQRDTEILIQAEKFLCMPNHPMKGADT